MLQTYFLKAGPVAYPLLLCSIITLALMLERLWTLLHAPQKSGLNAGQRLLASKSHLSKVLRDEHMSLWLQEEKNRLTHTLRWLTLLGAIAPLLGLLGTVLGIISMFQDVATVKGAVTPALLASGMWEAMVTTAFGIGIAVPALISSHGFGIVAAQRIEKTAHALNLQSLAMSEESNTQQSGDEAVRS